MQEFEKPYATLVARLIEFGHAPEPDLVCPARWRKFYELVNLVRGTRNDRQDAFFAAAEEHADSMELQLTVNSLLPVRENRGRPIRVLRTARNALNPPPQLEWLVEGLLLRPSLNLLVGDPGTKKTLLSVDLAVTLALGQSWLGRKVQPCPTLFIDEETGIIRLHNMLNGCLRAHHATPETPLHYLSLPLYDLRKPEDCNDLREKAETERFGLIVIDALANTLRGADENSAQSVLPILDNLRFISETSRSAIWVVHHNNKEGAFRGSSAISASVDLMLSIQSSPGEDLITLTPLKSRIAAPQPFVARIHFDGPLFHLAPADLDSSARSRRPLSRSSRKLLAFLQAHGQAATPQLVHHLQGLTPGSVRQLVHDLVTAGYLIRTDGGSRGTPASFSLSALGADFLNEQSD